MRIIIVGGSALGLNLARLLIRKGHELILIERDITRAQELSETLDCTVIQAEGTRPDILDKAEIEKAQAIVACTDYDQDNIIIGLVARSAGVPEIILTTYDAQFLAVAKKLGFHHVINPPHTASVIISDTLRGLDTIELSTLVRGDVRFMSLISGERQAGKSFSDIPLPKNSAYIGLYRDSNFILHTENPMLQAGDEILFVTVTEAEESLCDIFCELEPEPVE